MLAFAAVGCSKADLSVAPKQNTPSSLQVTAIDDNGNSVDSASVFFDGVLVGVTPYSKENIEPGLHSIRVSEAGFKLFTDQLVAIQGQRYIVEAMLTPIPVNEGELVISVNLDSVRVRVMDLSDGVVLETSDRISAYMLPPGMYKVTGEKEDLPRVEETAEVHSGQTTTVFLELQTPQNIPTLAFTIAEDTVKTGESINLHWESDGIQVIIDQGVGVRGPNGSERVVRTTPGMKIFTATAFSTTNETTEKKDTVYVFSEDVLPPTLRFEIDADTVEVGQQINLTWETDGFQVIIDQGVGTRGPSGTERISCSSPGLKIFTATAYGAANLTTQKKDTVFVVAGTKLPPTLMFEIDADTVKVGEQINLTWDTDGYQVIIDQGVGTRGPKGTERIVCNTPGLKFFTATAYNTANLTTQKKDSVFVVAETGMPPTLNFEVIQDTITVGEQVAIEWHSNADHVIIDQGVGLRGPNGSDRITCPTPGLKIFTAIAYGSTNLTTEKKDSVYVKARSATPPTLEFKILQDTVKLGEPIDLEWLSDGQQVIIDQGVGVRGPQGSDRIVCPAPGLKVFTATAFSEAGLTTVKKDTVFILAEVPEPPTLAFEVLQDSVEVEQAAQLRWETNGLQVFIDQGVGSRGPSGTEEVVFHSPGLKIFTAVAFGEGNLSTTSKDSIYVKEAPLPPNPVVMLSTTRQVTVNKPATITWQTQNADYVTVDLVNNPALEGNVQVTFTSPGFRFVTATAFNQSGWTSVTDTIEVVDLVIEPPVNDILIPASVSVRADRGEEGMVQRAAGLFDIQKAGRYRLHAEVWYNSGDAQLNESYYVDLEDGTGNTKHPIDRNAGVNRVVPDDPGDPHTISRNSGTFNLEPGAHIINVYHYAKIASTYPRFINGQISGAESVKILGFRLVFLGD